MDTEKTIKEIEAKTYAYFSAVLIGPLIIDSAMLIRKFFSDVIYYLTYHNEVMESDDRYVDVKDIPIYGILGLFFALVLIFLIKYFVKRIRSIEKKTVPIIISIRPVR